MIRHLFARHRHCQDTLTASQLIQINLMQIDSDQNSNKQSTLAKKSWAIQSSSQAIREGSQHQKILNVQQEGEVFKALNSMKIQSKFAGIYITADQTQTYAEVMAWINLLKNIDPKLSITVGSNSQVKAK